MQQAGDETAAASPATADELRAELAALRAQKVDDWLEQIRYGSVIPLAVESSLSWRLTRPVRLAQTAVGVLRRDGAARFWSTARARLARQAGRR